MGVLCLSPRSVAKQINIKINVFVGQSFCVTSNAILSHPNSVVLLFYNVCSNDQYCLILLRKIFAEIFGQFAKNVWPLEVFKFWVSTAYVSITRQHQHYFSLWQIVYWKCDVMFFVMIFVASYPPPNVVFRTFGVFTFWLLLLLISVLTTDTVAFCAVWSFCTCFAAHFRRPNFHPEFVHFWGFAFWVYTVRLQWWIKQHFYNWPWGSEPNRDLYPTSTFLRLINMQKAHFIQFISSISQMLFFFLQKNITLPQL